MRLLLLFCLMPLLASGQQSLLLAGPMPGYSAARESVVWVQTREPAVVSMRYWVSGNPEEGEFSVTVQTERQSACTAHLLADRVVAGFTYAYELSINGKPCRFDAPTTFKTQPVWRFRDGPPSFRFALGSCVYVNETAYDRPGPAYGGNYEIFDAIAAKKPDFMLWLGDNTYFRPADWSSRSGMIARMSTNRSLPEMQKLLRSTHHYAIWDDHDYGPNDSDRSWVHKDIAHDLFRMFWANPSYGLATHADGRLPGPGGITSFFSWADADFFLLDNRWFRSPNAMEVGQRTVLGEEQVEWLVEALIASGARWKFVAMGGQFLNTARMWETYANLAPSEREYLLERIAQEGIEGVVFLSGDRHHSELSRIDYKGIRIWDVTTSPLTANPHRPRDDERNELLVEGSLVSERNFAVLEISGPEDERSLVMHFYDSKGTEVYSSELGKQDADR